MTFGEYVIDFALTLATTGAIMVGLGLFVGIIGAIASRFQI